MRLLDCKKSWKWMKQLWSVVPQSLSNTYSLIIPGGFCTSLMSWSQLLKQGRFWLQPLALLQLIFHSWGLSICVNLPMQYKEKMYSIFMVFCTILHVYKKQYLFGLAWNVLVISQYLVWRHILGDHVSPLLLENSNTLAPAFPAWWSCPQSVPISFVWADEE